MKLNKYSTVFLLIAGTFFLFFSNGRFSFALASWLFPLFFLFVSRKAKRPIIFFIVSILCAISTQLSFWKIVPADTNELIFYIPTFWGLLIGFLFYLDSKIYPRLKGFWATLFFPLAYTSLDFLSNLFNPFGTLGALGYSQINFLAFSQLASITGIWGLTFMTTWFSSVIYWIIENYSNTQLIRKGILLYFGFLILILTYGSIRLILPQNTNTIRIAGIHTHDKNFEGVAMHETLDQKDTIAFRKVSNTIIQRLIDATKDEAKAGAKIVVWSEISPKFLIQDEDSLYAVFKSLAKELKIYLVTSPFVVCSDSVKSENKIVLFDTAGNIILEHYKYGGAFIEGTKEGNKKIKTLKTPYGNIAGLICWDGDFPTIVKQIGKANTDILIVPASDWNEVDPSHAIVTIYRGIENGCSVFRQTRNGLSIITDQRGKTISEMDHFSTKNWTMIGQVPTKKWFTMYPIIGDLFGWLSMVGLIFLLLFRSRKSVQ